MPSPPNGPFLSHRFRTKACRSASDAKSRGVMAATKMSFFEPCAFRISAISVRLLGPGYFGRTIGSGAEGVVAGGRWRAEERGRARAGRAERGIGGKPHPLGVVPQRHPGPVEHVRGDRKSTRLNSSHL